MPIDFRNNVIGRDAKPEDMLDDRYEQNIPVASVRFEYETTVGVAPTLDVRAQISVFDEKGLRVPKYDAVWHLTEHRSKRFNSGDFDDLILGLLTPQGMAAYEFNMEAYEDYSGSKYLCPRVTGLEGEVFFLRVILIATKPGKEVVFNKQEWFCLKPNEEGAKLVNVAEPPRHLL